MSLRNQSQRMDKSDCFLAKNLELRKKLGKKSYETLVSKYSYVNVYNKLKNILLATMKKIKDFNSNNT